jgi:transcriptional regulator with XRE-family HTH domain
MGPEHVAYGLRASYGLPYATPDLVIAWERGIAAPSSPELTALAGVLWCSASELIGAPRTLREHRVARDLAPEDVAHAVGIELLAYERMEESGTWRGNERQSTALAKALDLSLPDFITVTGRDGRLADLLRSAVTTRWQASVRPVAKVVPLGRMAATLNWGGGPAATGSGESGQDFLDRIVDHFWTAVRASAY